MTRRSWLFVPALVSITAPVIRAQTSTPTAAQVTAFLGHLGPSQ